MSVLKIFKQDLIHYKVNYMTNTEYEKQKEELEKEFALKKGKLAEEYLKEHGILDENGRPKMYTSFVDWPSADLYNLREKLLTLVNAIEKQIGIKNHKDW